MFMLQYECNINYFILILCLLLLSLMKIASSDAKLSYQIDLASDGFRTMLRGLQLKNCVHHASSASEKNPTSQVCL